jgi:uncharacterized protein YkwD
MGIRMSREETELLTWINIFRRGHGRGSLYPNRKLRRRARRWAKHMARTGEFDHNGFDRRTRGWAFAGEVIAIADSPKQAIEIWKHSPPHKAILLDHYRSAGVANAGRYWCVDVVR